MAGEPTSRRRRCRPDRALRHAELADLARIHGVWTLRDSVQDAGGDQAWDELLERIDGARRGLGSKVSLSACICGLSVLYALHRSGEVGFRGLIGSSQAIADRIAEIIGFPRGFSLRTCGEAWRVLEAADLVERWTHGRGRQVELTDAHTRRRVLALTLSIVAISYWSGTKRKVKTHISAEKPSSANVADNTSGRIREATPPRYAHPSIPVSIATDEQIKAETAVPAVAFARGAGRKDTGARPVPHRWTPWRPGRDEPNSWGTATTALLYDLETAVLHHRRADRDRIVGLARAELDPSRHLWGGAPPGSCLPWADLVWGWRGMPLQTRRETCERALIPGLAGHLHRLDLWAMPREPGSVPHPGAREPGPRAVPEKNQAPPPPRAPVVRRPAPAWRPPPKPEWLERLERRWTETEDT